MGCKHNDLQGTGSLDFKAAKEGTGAGVTVVGSAFLGFSIARALGTEAEGKPCGFCKVMTSVLGGKCQIMMGQCKSDLLFECDVVNQVFPSFDALCQKDISCGCNCDDMRVFAERFEGDWVMNFTSGFFPGVMQSYEI